MGNSLIRLVLVYTAVFLLSCTAFAYGRSARVEQARVSIESFASQKDYRKVPLFSKFHYKASKFQGDFDVAIEQLKVFYQERKQVTAKYQAKVLGQARRLKKERKQVQRRAKRSLRTGGDATQWANELSNNIASRAFLYKSHLDRLAKWESQNWVEVVYTKEGPRLYLLSIAVHRERKNEHLASDR